MRVDNKSWLAKWSLRHSCSQLVLCNKASTGFDMSCAPFEKSFISLADVRRSVWTRSLIACWSSNVRKDVYEGLRCSTQHSSQRHCDTRKEILSAARRMQDSPPFKSTSSS